MIIIDADGAERDWEWVKKKYNLPPIVKAPRDKDHWEVVELHEQIGNSSMTVRLLDVDGKPYKGILIMFDWPDGEVEQLTNLEGHTGFGMGGGAYYRPDRDESGPHSVWIPYTPSTVTDRVRGLGMIAGTNHAHLEPTFQFMRGGEPSPVGCEEYISALERIREIVDDLCPGALI